VFPMPCRVRAQIEQQILNYRDEQQAQLQQRQARVEVCVGQMRPFEQMVLVLLDLPSGYICGVPSHSTRLSDLARASATGAWFDCLCQVSRK